MLLTVSMILMLAGVTVRGEFGPTGLTGATGSTGDQGSTGVTGFQGERGSPGPSGSPGPMGPPGSRGEQGYQGDRGDSGYDGHDGRPGSKGPQGGTGSSGSTGMLGPSGPAGPTGERGPAGPSGPIGPSGMRGPQGVFGPTGRTGATGQRGLTGRDGGRNGATGATGQPGGPGPPGDSVVDTDECNSTSVFPKCEHICINTFGSYRCDCHTGYELDDSKHNCHDVDECWYRNGHCEHTCTNRAGGYDCSCKEGYTLEQNKLMCVKTFADKTSELPMWLFIVIMLFGFLIFVLLVSNCVLIGVVKRLRKSHKSHQRSTRSTASLPSFVEIHGKGSMTSSVKSSPWTHHFSTASRTQALPTIPQDEATIPRDEAMLARQSSYSGYMQPTINAAPYENSGPTRHSETSPIYLELSPEAAGYQGLQRASVGPGNKYEKVQTPDTSDDKTKGPTADSAENLDGIENSEIFADDPNKAKELEGDNNSQKKLIDADEEEEPRYQKFK